MRSLFNNFIGIVCFIFLAGCNSGETTTTDTSIDTNNIVETKTNPGTEVIVTGTPSTPALNLDGMPIRMIGQMILEGKLKPADNPYTFQLMDSLQAVNQTERRFYFGVFNIIMNHADGALGEAIGDFALTYVEQYPAEFINNMKSFPADRFETWASHIGIELFLSGNDPKDSFNTFSRMIIGNCKGCNSATISRIKQFNQLVWQTMQANIKSEEVISNTH